MARILVIDDEETIRFAFETMLSDEGHTVTTSGSYEEAIEKLADSSFDLVFADIRLGDRPGTEILRYAQEHGADYPIVMITGQPSLETASEAVRLGAFDYIPKPVRQLTLLDVTVRALKHKALVDEKERYRCHLEAIFRSVSDAIITVDREMVITSVNDAAAEICGLSGSAVGSQLSAFRQYFSRECLDMIGRALSKGRKEKAVRVEYKPDNLPKRVVTVEVSPLVHDPDTVSGAVMVLKDETRLDTLERDLEERRQFHHIIGKCYRMQQVYDLIEELAGLDTTVLITGETGTGKDLVASALHYRGARSKKPFVKVNCSALSEGLLESELFGHVRGAFTDAVQDKIGRFERADGGTILLDEIGDVSPLIQLRLLRVLQEREFEKVGDSATIRVDVRVIAATNRDLRERVQKGEFRNDLYYRLKVVEIHMPPLRQRREDIPLLIHHFLKKYNERFGKEISSVTADVQRLFLDYPWPGNVRELEHALEHAFIVCNMGVITIDDLPAELRNFLATEPCSREGRPTPGREEVIEALERTGWNKADTARLLGVSRQTIYRKIREFGIRRETR